MVGLSMVLLLVCVLAPPLHGPGEASPETLCYGNIRQIGLALLQYESSAGSFPPSHTADAAGQPLHSWRTLILPYLDYGNVYVQLDQSVPWNDPANTGVLNLRPMTYFCPADRHSRNVDNTSYIAVTGPETMWPGDHGRRLDEVTDRLANTILLVETSRTDIDWAEPRDVTLEELLASFRSGDPGGAGSLHLGGGFHAVFADGSVRYIDPSKINEPTLRAMFTVAGND